MTYPVVNTTFRETKGVKTLLGDPKRAIVKLAIPMIIAMSVQTIYNFVDALWVSGLGATFFTSVDIAETGKNALAAIGFVLPFYMMAISISTGLGVGGGSAISRRIGAKDKIGADNIAIHSIVISTLIALAYLFLLVLMNQQVWLYRMVGLFLLDLLSSFLQIWQTLY